MARFFLHDFSLEPRKSGRILLAFGWLLGLFLGARMYIHADSSVITLMRSAVSCTVSIVGLVGVTILPFLISAFAVFIGCPRLLALTACGKGMLFSFASLCAMAAFGNAGWLVYPLLCFSEICMAPVLYLYWLRNISGGRGDLRELIPYLTAGAVIGCVDYCVISPLLAVL